MPTVLITGAGRGLGLEFAKQYADDGDHGRGGTRTHEALQGPALESFPGDAG